MSATIIWIMTTKMILTKVIDWYIGRHMRQFITTFQWYAEDDDDADDIGAEEEPLNSADDVSEEEQSDLFDTDNVVVCQYDKVSGHLHASRPHDTFR